jgi:hypothetical protein
VRNIADTSSNSPFQVVVLTPTVTSDNRTIDEGIILCRAVIAVTWQALAAFR